MFIQVIHGRVRDQGKLRAALDDWHERLAPQATGFLGSTAGVTADGRFLALARFESEDAARRNSEREEQGQWWSQTSRLFDGEATFRNSTRVDVDLVGDPDSAGFVQVIQGRTSDPERARQLMGADDSGRWAEFRPDILGSVTAEHEDGAFTTVIYFTTEEEAREGERKEPPSDIAAQMEEMTSLTVGAPEFFDLQEPWLYSHR